MQLDGIFFARFAELGPDGLFTVVGGMNRINAGELPWGWGFLFLVVRARLTTEEAQAPHVTTVERETPSGRREPRGEESPMAQPPPTPPDLGPDGRVGLTFIICLVSPVFPEAGVYKYRLKIDGQEIGVAELLVTAPAEGAPDK